MKYILTRTGHPIVEPDYRRWAEWMEQNESRRRVALTEVGDAIVSTVFLGIDHNFGGEGPPIVFETMIFGGQENDFQYRYSDRFEAEAGHKLAVEQLQKRQNRIIR